MSNPPTAEAISLAERRLSRLYAGEAAKVIYGVRTMDAAAWHREQDERALAKAWLVRKASEPPHGACDACGHPNKADGCCSRSSCCNSD